MHMHAYAQFMAESARFLYALQAYTAYKTFNSLLALKAYVNKLQAHPKHTATNFLWMLRVSYRHISAQKSAI